LIDLAYPWALVVPFLGGLVLLGLRRPPPRVPLPLPVRRSGHSGRWVDRAPALLRGGAIVGLALAGAAPVRSARASAAEASGVAVMLVLDVSPSMQTELPGARTKLDAARHEIERFLDGRSGDAAGLVTFGREALVRAPPSSDREALLAALRTAESENLGEGTALGTALGLAADRLRGLDAPSKVIVLLTDGESNAGALDPVTAARAAGALGQRVHVVDASVDEDARRLLEEVARAGGGLHRPVDDVAGLDAAYREIDAMEPGRFVRRGQPGRTPTGRPLLWLALALLAGERALRASRWGTLP
jgi:Ca-activated chloride channel family protein